MSSFVINSAKHVGFAQSLPVGYGVDPNIITPLGIAERGISIRYDVRDVYYPNAFAVSSQNGLGWFYAGSAAYLEVVLTRPDFGGLYSLFSYVLPVRRSLAYIGAPSSRSLVSPANRPFVTLCLFSVLPVGFVPNVVIYNALLVSASQLDIGPIPSKIHLTFKAEDRYDIAGLSTVLSASV